MIIFNVIVARIILTVMAKPRNSPLLRLATVSTQACAVTAVLAVFNILAAFAEVNMQRSTALRGLSSHLAHRKPALWFSWT